MGARGKRKDSKKDAKKETKKDLKAKKKTSKKDKKSRRKSTSSDSSSSVSSSESKPDFSVAELEETLKIAEAFGLKLGVVPQKSVLIWLLKILYRRENKD